MQFSDYQQYIVPALVIVFFGWRIMKFKKVKSNLPKLIEEGAIIVDVRSPEEFRQGSRPGSKNIPLGEIGTRLKELDPQKTIILCCASGTRSGMAASILKSNGFEKVFNAGPWTNTL